MLGCNLGLFLVNSFCQFVVLVSLFFPRSLLVSPSFLIQQLPLEYVCSNLKEYLINRNVFMMLGCNLGLFLVNSFCQFVVLVSLFSPSSSFLILLLLWLSHLTRII